MAKSLSLPGPQGPNAQMGIRDPGDLLTLMGMAGVETRTVWPSLLAVEIHRPSVGFCCPGHLTLTSTYPPVLASKTGTSAVKDPI